MVPIVRTPHGENTRQVAFVNMNNKTKDLTGTAMLLFTDKYGQKNNDINCYQFQIMGNYLSSFQINRSRRDQRQ